jgi:hypothetical protein
MEASHHTKRKADRQGLLNVGSYSVCESLRREQLVYPTTTNPAHSLIDNYREMIDVLSIGNGQFEDVFVYLYCGYYEKTHNAPDNCASRKPNHCSNATDHLKKGSHQSRD